jgi:thiol-disulfide isomerase/thioredoxin
MLTDTDTTEEKDPYAIPENASVEELFAFIKKMKDVKPPRNAVAETAKKVFPAILEAADLVIEKSEVPEDVAKAVLDKFNAFGILVRFDPSARADLAKMVEDYRESENPEIAVLAAGHLLNEKSSLGRSMSQEQAEELSSEAIAFLEKFGLSSQTYSTVSEIARNMGYGENTEIAAQLYEKMVPFLRESDDARLAERADTMLGAARRLRLLGNTMEVFGTTAAGEPFEWSDYKGKVVLVDFWASWCGPCLSEIPNMKKNLELYGERGFTIVGINMDDTRDRFESCVEDREITWVNICSSEEGKTGWKAPMATHYGITGIPTAILVDGAGKVVSLRARGVELDRLLEGLLGPPETTEEGDSDSAESTETEGADRK